MIGKCKQQNCANPSWCKLTGKCLVEQFPQTTRAVDCRTCSHYDDTGPGADICYADICSNGDRYDPLPVVQLWRTK